MTSSGVPKQPEPTRIPVEDDEKLRRLNLEEQARVSGLSGRDSTSQGMGKLGDTSKASTRANTGGARSIG